eukprot:TRINITY_DN13668_c0_g1_i1.p1 TRINITY_DN13668_c0_g1~~TRINITY_DN13668_c0_g1_i1.p1  ORF type:complete len:301 (-),score=66.62 TRINITY_DN13668_c0_g1_i1:159-1061(-)
MASAAAVSSSAVSAAAKHAAASWPASTTAAAAASSAAGFAAVAVGDDGSACQGGTCELFGFFGICVQCFIGLWCVFTLAVMWRCEENPRSFLTWLADMSKQMVGAGWGHFMNVFVAVLFGKAMMDASQNNQCVWYLVGFLCDVLFVTFLCWAANVALRPVIRERCGIDIGDYEGESGSAAAESEGDVEDAEGKPKADLGCLAGRSTIFLWCLQTLIWLSIMTVVKATVSFGVYLASDQLYFAVSSAFDLIGLCGREKAQLIASVVVIPLIGDAFQFAVQDTFLKKGKDPDSSGNDSNSDE